MKAVNRTLGAPKLTALAVAGVCALAVGSPVRSADAYSALLATDAQLRAQAASPHALQELMARARAGETGAQLAVAKIHHAGLNGNVDVGEARRWYRVAAEQGLPEAEFQLGMLYLYGQGVTECEDTALRWIGRAVKHGHSDAATLYDYLIHNESGIGC